MTSSDTLKSAVSPKTAYKELPLYLMRLDMAKLAFVQWDRYVPGESSVDLYGWIKRKDAHEDFVLLCYKYGGAVENGENWEMSYSTSSAEYTDEIFRLLDCIGEHNPCMRVEDIEELLPNVIRLGVKTRRAPPTDESVGICTEDSL